MTSVVPLTSLVWSTETTTWLPSSICPTSAVVSAEYDAVQAERSAARAATEVFMFIGR